MISMQNVNIAPSATKFSLHLLVGAVVLSFGLVSNAFGQQGTAPAPTEIETRLGKLTYEAGYPTKETTDKLYDEIEYQRAVLAYQLVDNLVSYYSMDVGFQEAGADEGDLIVWERFADPKLIALTPNHTTIYGMSFLNLERDGPMIVEVPPSPFLGGLFDLWMVPLVGIDAQGGKFLVASHDYKGPVPKGATLIRSRTGIAAFFARGLVIKGDIKTAAQTVKNCRIYPLSKQKNPPPTKIVPATGVAIDTISPTNPDDFWPRAAKALSYVSADKSVDPDASLVLSLLKPLGITHDKPFNPDARQRRILNDAGKMAWHHSLAISFAPRLEDVIYYPGTQWEWVLMLDPTLRDGFWRDLDARINYYFQGTMALPAMKNKAIGKGSQYLRSSRDAEGNWLDGKHTYRLRVPRNPPIKLNWSVTVYDYETRSQIQTDTKVAALDSDDKLQKNADGSVDLYFGPEAPEGKETNWIKTVPSRGWWVWFRFYSPTEAFFEKSWKLPDFERIRR